MKTTIEIEGLSCLCSLRDDCDEVVYILYPMDLLEAWIEPAVEKYLTSIVVITEMDWDNVFSPWPAPGQPPGDPPFKGQSQEFLDLLRIKILPRLESQLKFKPTIVRTLVGVSMSGLFALWQWMLCDLFTNIASLSGSFWYPGFMDWLKGLTLPHKEGKSYFLLGKKEPNSPVRAFESVGRNTVEIVSLLKSHGIAAQFQSVAGNHFTDPIPRLDKALSALFMG